MSYELFQQGPAVYVPIILLSLIITLGAYCAFPLIFAKFRKKIITKKKYRVLCYCVNLAVMALFIVKNGHHAIVSRDIFEEAQRILNNKSHYKITSTSHPKVESEYTHFVYCPYCNNYYLD